jgi:hypothetical protein
VLNLIYCLLIFSLSGKAMVKAFAVCGDVQRAFAIVDELCQRFTPDPEMFSFLLMACISDTQAGLKHAIQVLSN